VARNDFGPGEVERLTARVLEDLRRCGLLRADDRIVARQVMVVDPAYVVFDEHRRTAVPDLLGWLAERGIRSIGRYGRWEYGSMEDAIHQGMATAAELADAGVTTHSEEGSCPSPPASASSTS
jgi:hypothetical protein